ncbi:MAG TPA: GAF domain-containing protein, partial [Anaerolineales bacterium]|nr:GAF domain-containing protein [Anaerolineales bacterium]
VAERTADLERRSLQLEAAAQVAREAAGIRDVGELLEETVRLISERFGFYHAGIFLLDRAGEWAVLRAASSEGGRRMLRRGHRLRVGEEGIVGHVAATGRSRIAQAVGEEAVFFDNPDLPETRAEAALPLAVRGRIIGVLDIQSRREGAFTEEDVAILRVMADQLALSIENARLLMESRRALERVSRYRVEETLKAWREAMLRRGGHLAYFYDRTAVRPLPADETPISLGRGDLPREVAVHSHPDGRSVLVAPIRVHDQIIGVLSFEARRAWRRDEVALVETAVEQMGLALENARLLEETRRRAERDRLIADITAKVRASADVETILRTAVRELGAALGTDRTFVQVGAGVPSSREG